MWFQGCSDVPGKSVPKEGFWGFNPFFAPISYDRRPLCLLKVKNPTLSAFFVHGLGSRGLLGSLRWMYEGLLRSFF